MFFIIGFWVLATLHTLGAIASVFYRKRRIKADEEIERLQQQKIMILCRMVGTGSYDIGKKRGMIQSTRDFIEENKDWIPKDVLKQVKTELDVLEIKVSTEKREYNENLKKAHDGIAIFDGYYGSDTVNN